MGQPRGDTVKQANIESVRMIGLGADKALSGQAQVTRTLGTEILAGVHEPGANLPAEPELLARFQISRTVLREAIKTLSAKGLIASKTRVGTRVLDPSHWNFFDPDILAWKVGLGLDATFRTNLTEIRQAIEPLAAGLAAQRRTKAQLAELRRYVEAMRGPHTRQSFAEADLHFHVAIGHASGNPLVRSIAGVIEAALVASFSLSSPTEDPRLQEQTVRLHEAIVDAIEAKDADAAGRAMLAVIDAGVDRISSPRKARAPAKVAPKPRAKT
jgi:DNA-binding FadR family transcriptional regulator